MTHQVKYLTQQGAGPGCCSLLVFKGRIGSLYTEGHRLWLSTMRLQSGHQVHYVVWAACPSQGVDGA